MTIEPPTASTAPPYRVFWQPGCSSCVKVKEFLTQLGIAFESVNVLNNAEALAEMRELGVRAVPFVRQGNRFTFAQSLDQVASFVGKKNTSMRRDPESLVGSWLNILRKSISYVDIIPQSHFDTPVFPGRDRTTGALAYHIFQVVEAFVATATDGLEEWFTIANPEPPETIRTAVDIVCYGTRQIEAVEGWWRSLPGKDDGSWQRTFGRIAMFSGPEAPHAFLERSTWHSAQHARQLASILTALKLSASRPLVIRDYEGLPLPAGLWE